MPEVEAKEPFTTASAHTAVRNGFCIRLDQPWDAKVPKYTAKNGTAWCRWAWLSLAGRGLARPGMLLSPKDAKENPNSTGTVDDVKLNVPLDESKFKNPLKS